MKISDRAAFSSMMKAPGTLRLLSHKTSGDPDNAAADRIASAVGLS
jgi:hypothetical protein